MAEPRYELRPIGRVDASGNPMSLQIDETFRPALEGLAGFSHTVVVFWCHLADTDESRGLLTYEQPYANAPDRLGIFATRSPARPNPIGITAVPILHLDPENGAIHIPFIDAEDGTPILDLKPYQPSFDRIRDVRTPEWCAHWPQWGEDSATFDWAAEIGSP